MKTSDTFELHSRTNFKSDPKAAALPQLKDMLRTEEIAAAKRDRSHIVIQVFDGLGEKHWNTLLQSLRTADNEQQQKLREKSFVPFAEALEGKVFTLMPLEIVSIWSRAMEVFPNNRYPRYTLSTAIAYTYGAIPIKSEEWKHLFKMAHEKGYDHLEYLAGKDTPNAIRFRQRLLEVDKSLQELNYYMYGTRENMGSLAVKAYGEGNKEAQKRYEQMVLWQKTHDDMILGAIHENWANGITVPMMQTEQKQG